MNFFSYLPHRIFYLQSTSVDGINLLVVSRKHLGSALRFLSVIQIDDQNDGLALRQLVRVVWKPSVAILFQLLEGGSG